MTVSLVPRRLRRYDGGALAGAGDIDLTDGRLVAAVLTALETSTAALQAAVATRVNERGAWAAETAYAAYDQVARSGATYLALQTVPANTAALTTPGTGTAWRTYWRRVGYADGDPDAFTGATYADGALSLQRLSGLHPFTAHIAQPQGPDYAPVQRVESIGQTGTLTVPARSWARLANFAAAPEVEFGDGAAAIITRTSGSVITVAAGVYMMFVEGSIRTAEDRADAEFRVTDSAGSTTLARSDSRYYRNAGDSSSSSLTKDLHVVLSGKVILTAATAVGVWLGSAPDLSGAPGSPLAGETFRAENDIKVSLVPMGGSEPVFQTRTIGTATLTVTADADVQRSALTTAGGDALVCPTAGWVIATFDSAPLGLEASSQWVKASKLRAARSGTETTGGLYCNAAGELFLEYTVSSAGEIAIEIDHVEATPTTGGGTTPATNPTVSSFTLQGDLHPAAGDIGGSEYDASWSIAQSSHVHLARIVAFAGVAREPTGVTVLHTISEALYHGGSATVTLPGTVNLAADETETVRLEVYGDGQTAADNPVSYQDQRIVAHEPTTARYHWGRVERVDSETASQTAARIAGWTNWQSADGSTGGGDIDTDQNLASGYPATPIEGDGSGSDHWQFYLAALTTAPQVGGWNSSGLPASAAFLPAVEHDVGSAGYTWYILRPTLARTFADGTITYNPVEAS